MTGLNRAHLSDDSGSAAGTTRSRRDEKPAPLVVHDLDGHVTFTRLTNTLGLLTKVFSLNEDGGIKKETHALLSEGKAETLRVSSLKEFDDLLNKLTNHQALCYGVFDGVEARVVTKNKVHEHPGAIARSRKFFAFPRGPAILMIDHDAEHAKEPIADGEALRAALIQACPELAGAPMLWRPSASSCIVDGTTGEEITGLRGQRLYILIADGSDIARAGKALYERLWRAGFGHFIVAKSGRLLDRNIIDAAVFQPERMDFAAGAKCIPTLKQQRIESRIWNEAAGPFDSRKIADLNAEEQERVRVQRRDARAAMADEAARVRDKYIEAKASALSLAGNIGLAEARRIVGEAVDHELLYADFLLYPEHGEPVSVGAVLGDPKYWDGKRFADPIEPDYRDDPRIACADLFSGSGPRLYSHAHGGRNFTLLPRRPDTWQLPPPISDLELEHARLTPRCIVEHYLYADVALLVAPGGTGKTTLVLYELVHIALGLSLYGRTVQTPGPVVLISAEDSREMLVARLGRIAEALTLTPEEMRLVSDRVRISDVSGQALKLTQSQSSGGAILPTSAVDDIIAKCAPLRPVMIVIDPAISFGVGETRVNDAEQALVEVGRRICRALDCCVRFVHHTGKQSARDGAADQYASRGGSAFPDGARMVNVLQPLAGDKWAEATGSPLREGVSAMRLSQPKLSYATPQPDILLVRDGFNYSFCHPRNIDPALRLRETADQVHQFLMSELAVGRQYSARTLDSMASTINLSRSMLRAGRVMLEASGRVEARPILGVARGARTYLHPVAAPIAHGAAGSQDA
jgi:hypothetical protein